MDTIDDKYQNLNNLQRIPASLLTSILQYGTLGYMAQILLNMPDSLLAPLEGKRSDLGLRSRNATIIRAIENLCGTPKEEEPLDTRPIHDHRDGICQACCDGNHCNGGVILMEDGQELKVLNGSKTAWDRFLCNCKICMGLAPIGTKLASNPYDYMTDEANEKRQAKIDAKKAEIEAIRVKQPEPRRIGKLLSHGSEKSSIHPDDPLAHNKRLNDGLDDVPDRMESLYPPLSPEEEEMLRLVDEAVAIRAIDPSR